MKKIFLLAILVVLMLSINVKAAADIAITPVNLRVIAGITNTTSLNIINSGDLNLQEINLSVTNLSGTINIDRSNITLANQTINLSITEGATIGITVKVPTETPAGIYSGQIKASHESVNRTADIVVTVVSQDPQVSFTPSSLSGEWIAGYTTQKSLQLNVTNTGNIGLQEISISTSDLAFGSGKIDKSYIIISPASFNLAIGEKKTILLNIMNFPQDIATGIYSGTINATYSGKNKAAALALDVKAISQNIGYSSSLSGSWTANYTSETTLEVNVANTGNIPINNVAFSPTDLVSINSIIAKSSISVNPSLVNLDVGQSTKLLIKISGLATNITPGTYSGYINATFGQQSKTNQLSLNVASKSYSLSIGSGSIDLGYVELNRTISKEIIVTNNGNVPLTWVQLVNVSVNKKHNLTFNNTLPFNLAVGESKPVILTLQVPYGTYTGDDVNLGQIRIQATEYAANYTIYADVQGMLTLGKFTVKVDGKTETDPEAGSSFEKIAKPGSSVIFDIRVENLFDEDDDIEIEDIDVTATIQDIDDGDDLEEEASSFDLGGEDTHTVSFTFEIPYSVDEDSYDVLISVEGEDENGHVHAFEKKYILNVEKEKHDVVFKKYSISEQEVSCNRDIVVTAEIVNVGQKDEEDMKLKVYNSALALDESTVVDELSSDYDDDDNAFTKQFTIIVKDDAKAGNYPIGIAAYYDDGELADSEGVYLIVKNCDNPGSSTKSSSTQASTGSSSTQSSSASQSSNAQQSQAQASTNSNNNVNTNTNNANSAVTQANSAGNTSASTKSPGEADVVVSFTPQQASSQSTIAQQTVRATTTSVSSGSPKNLITSSSLRGNSGGDAEDDVYDGYMFLLILANIAVVGVIAVLIKNLFK